MWVVDPWSGGCGFQIWHLGVAEVAHVLPICKEGARKSRIWCLWQWICGGLWVYHPCLVAPFWVLLCLFIFRYVIISCFGFSSYLWSPVWDCSQHVGVGLRFVYGFMATTDQRFWFGFGVLSWWLGLVLWQWVSCGWKTRIAVGFKCFYFFLEWFEFV